MKEGQVHEAGLYAGFCRLGEGSVVLSLLTERDCVDSASSRARFFCGAGAGSGLTVGAASEPPAKVPRVSI